MGVSLLFQVCRILPNPPEDAISHYLRPFAIVLRIGEGRMICQFVNHKSLQDDQLPHTRKPSEFPTSTRPDIWATFRQEQWAFYALTLEYSRVRNIGPDEILPINQKNKNAKGGSPVTYKIPVDEDYDKLVPRERTVGRTFLPIWCQLLMDSRTLIFSARMPTY